MDPKYNIEYNRMQQWNVLELISIWISNEYDVKLSMLKHLLIHWARSLDFIIATTLNPRYSVHSVSFALS